MTKSQKQSSGRGYKFQDKVVSFLEANAGHWYTSGEVAKKLELDPRVVSSRIAEMAQMGIVLRAKKNFIEKGHRHRWLYSHKPRSHAKAEPLQPELELVAKLVGLDESPKYAPNPPPAPASELEEFSRGLLQLLELYEVPLPPKLVRMKGQLLS